jgi:hypothetical protein
VSARQADGDPPAARAARRVLLALLILALAQRLVRVAVVPLWQHYDEPAHFEYVRFLVEHRRLPRLDDVDRAIFDRIVATAPQIVPCPESGPRPPGGCFGPSSAFDEAPGYYLLQAAVQWLAGPDTVDVQVRLARFVSALLGVAVTGLGFHATRQLLPREPHLALAVAGLLATQPGYVDLMSALSNDVAAVAAFSVLFWAGTAVIRHGITPARLAALAAAAGLGVAAKSTAWIGVPLAGTAIWLAAWPRLPVLVAWGAPGLAGTTALLLAVTGAWPAQWFAFGPYPAARRVATSAPWGRYAFSVPFDGKHAPTLWQPIDVGARHALQGRTFTLGAWVRAPGGARPVPLPVLGVGDRRLDGPRLAATPAWRFHAYTVMVPANGPLALYVPEVEAGVAQYDGITVAAGVFPVDSPPHFDDADARTGSWGSVPFVNLVGNGSAEQGWPALRLAVDRRLPAAGLNYRLPSMFDCPRTWTAYWSAARWQFVTYWTGFGTGVAGGPRLVRVAFALLSIGASLGVVMMLPGALDADRMTGPERRGLAFATLAVIAVGVMNLLRIDPVDAVGRVAYVPTARYAYVAIVPAMMLLAVGWSAWWPARRRGLGLALLVAAMLGAGLWLFLMVQLPWYHGRP